MTTHPATLSDDALLARCEVMRTRGSGPGGRHRNSTDSRVVLRDRATGAEGAAGERRSQHDNLREALFRLRLALAVHVRRELGAEERASERWMSRVSAGRIACNVRHREFPSLLAEALDVAASVGWDTHAAASILRVTPTQFVRFVAGHHPALAELNRCRAARGLAPLR
jgi:hypothetical protein